MCTTELVAFAKLHDELTRRNVALIGNSIDSVYSHIAWVRNIKEKFGVDIEFPIIADLDMKVASAYGMVHAVGRNFDEILRVVDALQTVDKHAVACLSDWRPGDKGIVPPPLTTAAADERVADISDWYFSKKTL